MRKLLSLIVVLSFGTAEAGFFGNVANAALQGLATSYGTGTTGTTGLTNYGTNTYGTTGTTLNYGTTTLGTTGLTGTTGTTTTVNSTVISNLLTYMYQQAALIQSTYSTNSNIVTYTSNLGNILSTCQSNPNLVLNQLPTMLQYILAIYSVLNQYGVGANIKTLVNGYSQLLLASMGLS